MTIYFLEERFSKKKKKSEGNVLKRKNYSFYYKITVATDVPT